MRLLVLLLGAVPLFAQLDDNTLTVTATRNVTLAPDHASIFANVFTPSSSGLDEAVAALQGSGFAASDLSSVSSDFRDSSLVWSFWRSVSFSQVGDEIG